MKNLALFMVGLIAFACSCSSNKNIANISVNLNYTNTEQVPTVTGYPYGTALPTGGMSLAFPTISTPTNSASDMSEYHTSSSNLVSVTLDSLNLQITAPAGQNFNFLDSIELYLAGTGLPEQLLAYNYNVPKGQTTVALTPAPNFNIKNYFLLDTMNILTNMHINAVPLAGTTVNINSTFVMVANPL